MSTAYIDDCLLFAEDYEQCRQNICDTTTLSQAAGFIVHPTKSVLTPTQCIVYLGFWLDSSNMTIQLTGSKGAEVKQACLRLMDSNNTTIKFLAKVVELLVSSLPRVQYRQLFYRSCDIHKTRALKGSGGDFSAKTKLSQRCKDDLKWWVDNVKTTVKVIAMEKPSLVIKADASNSGWGACVEGHKKKTTGGSWSPDEAQEQINYKELLTAWLRFQCFAKSKKGVHGKILNDNTMAVAYLNNQGGNKTEV